MTKKEIAAGVAHKLPSSLQSTLLSDPTMLVAWENITPLARNEWICWITSAKKPETRDRRLKITHENLVAGKRRSCCWAGCPHR